MQPDQVAQALIGVEDEWQAQTSLFIECNSTSADSDSLVDCHAAPKAFEKSCKTVVQAMLQGSSGDRDSVHEYLNDVCSQSVMDGWHASQCHSFAKSIDAIMTGSAYENRVSLNTAGLCTRYWSQFLSSETLRRQQEEEASGIAEAKRAEAAKAKAAEEEAKSKAEEAAKAEEAKAKAAQEAAEKEEASTKMAAEKNNAAEDAKVSSVLAAAEQEEAKAKDESEKAKLQTEKAKADQTEENTTAEVLAANSTLVKGQNATLAK